MLVFPSTVTQLSLSQKTQYCVIHFLNRFFR